MNDDGNTLKLSNETSIIASHKLAIEKDQSNGSDLCVCQTGKAGRGVFAARPILAGTLINISHTILFPPEEYEKYGKFTQLDNYTYIWEKSLKGNTMVLALGLGSLFNHSFKSPNVSYSFDRHRQTIRYTLMRNVDSNEELCISYGSGKMWWEKVDETTEDQDQCENVRNDENWLSQFSKIDLTNDEN